MMVNGCKFIVLENKNGMIKLLFNNWLMINVKIK